MRKTIKNIIFDMGSVLIVFDVEYFLDRAGIKDINDREILKKEIYYSDLWIDMDAGLLDEMKMSEIVKDRLPDHLKQYVEELIYHWCEPLIEVKGMSELVFELKEKGYGIYLLSNASIMQKKYWPNVSCSSCFDGVVVSAYEKVMKPDPEIYRILLDRYDLDGKECLFIDDRQINLDAAEEFGIETYHFDEGDVNQLRQFIYDLS